MSDLKQEKLRKKLYSQLNWEDIATIEICKINDPLFGDWPGTGLHYALELNRYVGLRLWHLNLTDPQRGHPPKNI